MIRFLIGLLIGFLLGVEGYPRLEGKVLDLQTMNIINKNHQKEK